MALASKIASAKDCSRILVAEHVSAPSLPGAVHLEEIATCNGTACSLTLAGRTRGFVNPLLALSGYRTPLMLAAAAAMIIGEDPEPLSSFHEIPGRLSVSYDQGVLVVDNANSGTNSATTIEAAQYARNRSGTEPITLVIGQMEGDGAVCEGFSFDQIKSCINQILPARIVWVGSSPQEDTAEFRVLEPLIAAHEKTLGEAYNRALHITKKGSIVLAVKTWR
jgi:hypothetical protein